MEENGIGSVLIIDFHCAEGVTIVDISLGSLAISLREAETIRIVGIGVSRSGNKSPSSPSHLDSLIRESNQSGIADEGILILDSRSVASRDESVLKSSIVGVTDSVLGEDVIVGIVGVGMLGTIDIG
mgnify:CR=1 FL=1